MDCYPKLDGADLVVCTLHWTLTATDGNNSVGSYGTLALEPDGFMDLHGGFTPYEELTRTQVCGWVRSGLGEEKVKQMEVALAEQLTALANPSIVSPPLPWSA